MLDFNAFEESFSVSYVDNNGSIVIDVKKLKEDLIAALEVNEALGVDTDPKLLVEKIFKESGISILSVENITEVVKAVREAIETVKSQEQQNENEIEDDINIQDSFQEDIFQEEKKENPFLKHPEPKPYKSPF